MQAVQAGRYYNTENGRFISRDPIGYHDGMSLYNAYFAEKFALDPSGNRIITDIQEDSLHNIWNKWGSFGITISGPGIISYKGQDDIQEWQNSNGCWCAKVVKGKRGDMKLYVRIPNTNTANNKKLLVDEGSIDPSDPAKIRNTPLKDIEGHEMERAWVLIKGYFEYVKPSSSSESNVTKCGTICRKNKGEAKRILKDYLIELRKQAKLQFADYDKTEQAKISIENQNWVRNWNNEAMRYKKNKLHDSAVPPPFIPPPCDPLTNSY